jgi:hypothetical protein
LQTIASCMPWDLVSRLLKTPEQTGLALSILNTFAAHNAMPPKETLKNMIPLLLPLTYVFFFGDDFYSKDI